MQEKQVISTTLKVNIKVIYNIEYRHFLSTNSSALFNNRSFNTALIAVM